MKLKREREREGERGNCNNVKHKLSSGKRRQETLFIKIIIFLVIYKYL
jgi:hypothetical protein